MQFDYEAHFEFCKSGAWKDPAAIMTNAAKLLKSNVVALKKLAPQLKGAELGMAAVAAYNAGAGRVAKMLAAGKTLDDATFHPGYATKITKKADDLAGASGSWLTGLV
jgi:soluble lytic murein transglycosylase-like protein